MNIQEFRELISNSQNKISTIIDNASELSFPMKDLVAVVSDSFSDAEKVEFLSTFKKVALAQRLDVIKSIDSDEVKIGVIKNPELTEGVYQFNYIELLNSLHDEGKLSIFHDKEFLDSKGIVQYNIVDMAVKMSDQGKEQFLQDSELRELYDLNGYNYANVITSMESDTIERILEDKERILELLGENASYSLSIIIQKIEDQDKRFELVDKYELPNNYVAQVLAECADDKKSEVILSEKYDFSRYDTESLLTNYDVPNLLEFINQNQEFLKSKKARIFTIVKNLPKEKQLEFIAGMDSTDLSFEDKLKALAVLSEEAKAEIDRTGMSEEYKQALDMKFITDPSSKNWGSLEIDLDGDLSKYAGFDELISIRPQDVPFDKRDRLILLAKTCPRLNVNDELGLDSSTAQEFINGEEWVQDVLSNIHEDWTDIQKAAYIDYRVGKKISYTPDFDTEVCDEASARALWRIIDSGYGVCNGIAQVEQYLLSHVGIEAELIGSGRHSFLKVKNIEIPREDGTTVKGNTVFDPTWNLSAHRYDAYPNLFARSYEEIRKFDILTDGTDKGSHKNDEAFPEETIDIEENVLRQVYRSIGLAKENGHFPISDMMEQSDKIAAEDISTEEKIKKQLELLATTHPDFSECQNSTISILSGNVLNHPEMSFEKLVVNRVYNRADENKTPAIFVYYNIGQDREGFFVAEPGTKEFSYMDKEAFIASYECYERDLQATNGLRPWEKGAKEKEEDLNLSSGVVGDENLSKGDER